MNDETGFIAAVLRELAASTAVILAAWGALGGATNALTTKMRLRDAIRHILLGGLIAAGMGSVSMALVDELARPAARGGPGWRRRGVRRLSRREFSARPSSRSSSPGCAAERRATAMHELLRLARSIRCDPADAGQAFVHRVRVGLAVAALLLLLSLLR